MCVYFTVRALSHKGILRDVLVKARSYVYVWNPAVVIGNGESQAGRRLVCRIPMAPGNATVIHVVCTQNTPTQSV